MTNKGIFYGWWVVIALFFVGMIGPMGRYSLTTLAPFIQKDLTLTNTQIGLAFSIHLWAYCFMVLIAGWLVDHFGSRRTIFLGGFTLLVALALLSQLNNSWQLYLLFGLLAALGVSMTHFVPNQATSRKWFIKKAGLAGGIVTSAMGVGLAILSPILTGIAGNAGWRATWLVFGLTSGIVIMLLASLVVRDTPESMGLQPDGVVEASRQANMDLTIHNEVKWSPKEALHTSPFWLLLISSSVVQIPLQGVLTQVVMWGVSLGEHPATAGIFMTLVSLPSMLGKVTGGWLGDKYGKRKTMGVTYFASLLTMIGAWLIVNSRSSLAVIAILFGITYGIAAPLLPAYLGDLYGRASVGMLLGIQVSGGSVLGGLGPLLWGSIADATGRYNLACLLSATLYAVAIIALVFIDPRRLSRYKMKKTP